MGQNPAELMRPYLHEFLTAAYEHYNIIIWSATSMKWIEAKMTGLGVATNPNYKICMYFDYGAMITGESAFAPVSRGALLCDGRARC